jgi:hypothetical protein
MITDLLVIIDSVKGNRGFVIFATTHLPDLLDPALRRPGRFDETISLSPIPALYSRWMNYRYNMKYLNSSLFTTYSIPFNSTFNKGTTLDLAAYPFSSNSSQFEALFPFYSSLMNSAKIYKKRLSNFSNQLIVRNEQRNNMLTTYSSKNKVPVKKRILNVENDSVRLIKGVPKISDLFSTNQKYTEKDSSRLLHGSKTRNLLENFYTRATAYSAHLIMSLMIYTSETSLKMNPNNIKKRQLKWPTLKIMSLNSASFSDGNSSIYLSLFEEKNLNKKNFVQILLIHFIASKLAESFGLSSNLKKNYSMRNMFLSSDTLIKDDGLSSFRPRINLSNNRISSGSGFSPFLVNLNKRSDWENGASFLYSHIQKRFPNFKNNLSSWQTDKTQSDELVGATNKKENLNFNFSTFYSTKLLSFNNQYSLMEAPSPPSSNILLPAKRYENYKRTFKNQYLTSRHKNSTEKIQSHQQQRLLKRLYNYPIKEFFRKEKISSFSGGLGQSYLADRSTTSNLKNSNSVEPDKTKLGKQNILGSKFLKTNLTHSASPHQSYFVFAEIQNLEQKNLASLNQFSGVDLSYRKILYNRHRTYLINQWWNGQQGEHNSESTFLSDIDWRCTQLSSFHLRGDVQIDFPDTEQYYNPRNRRWILTNGDWDYWFNSETELKEIYSHSFYESFTKVYKTLDQNREIIDFCSDRLFACPIQSNPYLSQREILNLYKRFFS